MIIDACSDVIDWLVPLRAIVLTVPTPVDRLWSIKLSLCETSPGNSRREEWSECCKAEQTPKWSRVASPQARTPHARSKVLL